MSSTPAGVDQETWNALLQWSMRNAVSGEGLSTGDGTTPSNFKPMSQEDKDWLTRVMSEGVVDQVKRARELIDKIKSDVLSPVHAGRPVIDEGAKADAQDALLDTFDELQEITEQIDFAQNLVQIGGVPPLLEVITAGYADEAGVGSLIPDSLRCASLGVLATVAQNNPFAQNAFLNLRVLPIFEHILVATHPRDGTPRFSTALRLKALHGVSCLSRGYSPSESAFFLGTAAFSASPHVPTQEDADAAAAAEAARKVAAVKGRANQPATPPGAAAAAAADQPPTPPPQAADSTLSASDVPARLSYIDPEGWFVAEGLSSADPKYDVGEAFMLDGPSLLARVLSSSESEPKLKRKAAFLLHALCSADDLKPEWALAYAKACTAPLTAVLTTAPPGAEDAPLDVDLRESSLRALTTLAGKDALSAAEVFAEGRQQAFSQAQTEATSRAVAMGRSGGKGSDAFENAKVEVQMWKALMALSPPSP